MLGIYIGDLCYLLQQHKKEDDNKLMFWRVSAQHNSTKVCGQDFIINSQVYTHPTHVLWDTARGLGQQREVLESMSEDRCEELREGSKTIPPSHPSVKREKS